MAHTLLIREAKSAELLLRSEALTSSQERAEGEDGETCPRRAARHDLNMMLLSMQACCVAVANWLLRSDLEQVRI